MAKKAKYKAAPLTRSARWRLLFLAVFLGLVVYIAAGDGLLFEVWQQEKDLTVLEAQVSRLTTENDSLRQVLDQLDNDMDYIEKLAREELGLIKPGEVVIPLVPEEEQ
ncbi:MAG: septum formation initiator family protein [Candidatus Latescibacterota bacterium]|nr:septum formation initiator family protein [Candidatus Latescibacterota bacterium]